MASTTINVSVGNNNRNNYRSFGLKNRIKHPEYWKWESVRRSHDITASGLQSFNQVLEKYSKHIKANSAHVCALALQPAFNKSQELCPVRTGDLKASGDLSAQNGGFFRKGKATISYGIDGKPFYAAIVHDVYYRHAGITQWRYLRDALVMTMDETEEILRKQTSLTMGF